MNRTVLYVDQHNHYGGGQQMYFSVLRHLIGREWNVIAMVPDGGDTRARTDNKAVRYVPLPCATIRDGKKGVGDYWAHLRMLPTVTASIKEVVANHKCDLIYTGAPRLLTSIYRAAADANIPIVLHLEQMYRNRLWEWYLRYYARRRNVAKIILLSDTCRLWFERQVGRFEKTVVINNWLVRDDRPASQSRPTVLPSSVVGSFKYGVLGRVLPIKGQETFVKAALLQCKKESGTEFYVVGDTAFGESDYKARIQRAGEESPFKNRFHFVDHTDRVDLIYRELDCVVVPSVWDEPFGLVSIEAMHFEKALIVSDRGELATLAGRGDYAYMFGGGNELALLDAMDRVLHDRTETTRKIGLAKARVERDYGESAQLGKIYDQFLACMADSRPDQKLEGSPFEET
jgi:glycosyltransferase involved in cell wall biosynthesis